MKGRPSLSVNKPLAAKLFNQIAIRMDDWQPIYNTGNSSNGTDVWMLYNLPSDPGEGKNVAAQHPDILHKMIAAYKQFAENVSYNP
jgi:arylsulfatase A-like enzyme